MERRVHELDYLRGILAIMIMLYHNFLWMGMTFESDDFMGRIGVYGVSIFYVLSGFAMYFVYNYKFQLSSFFIKRIFRIYPLLVLVVLLAALLKESTPSWKFILLNLTGLFGFISPHSYISTGLWSIGNELVFYAFFPLLLFCFRYSLGIFITNLLAFISTIFFSFYLMENKVSLSSNWEYYVNPGNQIFFFVGGMTLAFLYKSIDIFMISRRVNIFILIIILFLFVFYPTQGGVNELIIGWNRMLFIFLSLLLCWLILFINFSPNKLFHRILSLFGGMSYSVYLLHPIIYLALRTAFNLQNLSFIYFCVSIMLTLITSYFVYTFYEKVFIRCGNSIGKSTAVLQENQKS